MANEGMRINWAKGGEGWVRHERTFDHVLSPFTVAIVRAAGIEPGHRVLDVGCGAGTLLEVAVRSGATAVGVDISPVMAAAAEQRVPAATVLTADAQVADLGGPYDRVVSRFGVMFFEDPVAAFTNIRSAAVPGAKLAFVCWREGEIDMFSNGLRAITARLASPPSPPAPGDPGPMGFANADHTRTVLARAGWDDVSVAAADALLDYSIDGSDGVEERLAVALASMVGRAARAELEPQLGPDGWDALVGEAREELRAGLVDGTVSFVGHTWLVTATNPR